MVVQLTLDPAASDPLLGLWADRSVAADLSFSGGSALPAADQEVLWQVHLPGDGDLAATTLATAQAELVLTRARLDAAHDHLAEWLATEGDTLRAHDVEVAFGAVHADRDREVPALAGPAVAAIGRLVRASAPTSWVETRCAERLVARSRTSFSGAVSTVVLAGEVAGVARHQETLALTSATRLAALQTTSATLQTAVTIAARLALPGGPLLALPLAWGFLQRIIRSPVGGREP